MPVVLAMKELDGKFQWSASGAIQPLVFIKEGFDFFCVCGLFFLVYCIVCASLQMKSPFSLETLLRRTASDIEPMSCYNGQRESFGRKRGDRRRKGQATRAASAPRLPGENRMNPLRQDCWPADLPLPTRLPLRNQTWRR